ncbi:MAG: hypothetical protein GY716_20255 [bacterium]|nr:hypothetical protein [bacterium]
MRRSIVLGFIALCCILAVGTTLTSAAPRELGHPARFAPGSLDEGLVQIKSPTDDRLWAAWAYRDGAEYDLAVSHTDSTGVWSEPQFFGRHDGRSQSQPALTIAEDGSIYLVFVDAGRLVLSALDGETGAWSLPRLLTGHSVRAAAPSVKIVGGSLVIAALVGNQIQILDLALPLASTAIGTHGINDGPDPFGHRGPRPVSERDRKRGQSEETQEEEEAPVGSIGRSTSK